MTHITYQVFIIIIIINSAKYCIFNIAKYVKSMQTVLMSLGAFAGFTYESITMHDLT